MENTKLTFTGQAWSMDTMAESTESIGKITRTMSGKTNISGSVTRDTMITTIQAKMEAAGAKDLTKAMVEKFIDAEAASVNDAFKSAHAIIKAGAGEIASVMVWTPITTFKVIDRKATTQRDTKLLLDIGAKRKELEATGMTKEQIDVNEEVIAMTAAYNATAREVSFDDTKITTKPLYVQSGVTSYDAILNRRAESGSAEKMAEKNAKKLAERATKLAEKAAAAQVAADEAAAAQA